MNETEIQQCNELYEIETAFQELGDRIFEEYKPEIMLGLTKLWLKLDELGVTLEAIRYPITVDYLRTMSTRIEYESVLMSSQLRDMFVESDSLSDKVKTNE